jgi:hypothetical protein
MAADTGAVLNTGSSCGQSYTVKISSSGKPYDAYIVMTIDRTGQSKFSFNRISQQKENNYKKKTTTKRNFRSFR